ncbi:hypothetical protein [Mesorhizobium sp. J428]|uniref:hypothetical protein n=1 Tax=Mesorhizobium sp. J428 TaxID=2898440 RepID=UPI00215157DC|nr:hypothetical protein [Mesorhizobium sp. J428]MCR5855551.1 hypothetical protein [Mesorhizobium sp. J428]
MNRCLTAFVLAIAALAGAACTSVDPTMGIATKPTPEPLPVVEPTQTASTPPQVAALTTEPARVSLAPVIGAPTEAVEQLSAELAARAPSKRFALQTSADPTATYTLKGFFSTSPEEGETIIFYVWDVMDTAGNRVHRFSGQERVKGKNQGWVDVTEANMRAIADRTADEFAAWLATRAG